MNPVPSPAPNPFGDLRFFETHRWRAVAVVSPGFARTGEPDGPLPQTGPVAPYAAVELDLGAVRGTVTAGLTDVRVAYDAARGQVRIEVGDETVRRRRVRLPGGATLGFALCESRVTALVRGTGTGSGWRPLLSERDRVRDRLDLREPAQLAEQHWAWSGGPGEVGAVRYGPFGMLGVRDPQLVRRADGTAYAEDGRVFVTWTCAGTGGFREAHWGVFAVDLDDPIRMQQTAHLFSGRGGRVYGDHAGALVRDGDRWLVAVSSWGDFTPDRGVHARWAASEADLLHGVHVLDTEPLALPTAPGHSTWDPSLHRSGPGQGPGWLVAYVAAPSVDPFRFHPALARTTDDDPFTALEPVGPVRSAGDADRLRATEGPVLVEADGRVWLVASDGRARRYPVFETGSLAEVGTLDAAYPTNIPHPQLVRHGDTWLMLSFDGTGLEPRRRHSGWRRIGRRPVLGYGTHGDAILMRATSPTGGPR